LSGIAKYGGLYETERLPAVRVSIALRNAAKDVLERGETLPSFMLGAVTREIKIRKCEQDFVVRGLEVGNRARKNNK
jgi:hypothetical protein